MRFCILQFQKIDDYVATISYNRTQHWYQTLHQIIKEKRYIGVDIAFFLEVPGGFEPPWLVLQTRD